MSTYLVSVSNNYVAYMSTDLVSVSNNYVPTWVQTWSQYLTIMWPT